MAFVSSSIPNLVNGVSQQPDVLRLPSQAEEQVNGFSSTASGLRKRAESEYIASLFPIGSSNPQDFKVHFINRDADEKYVVIIRNNSIRVFDLQGNEQTVTAPDGLSYLTSSNAQQDFRLLTVADFTFVVNKQTTVLETVNRYDDRPNEALVSVKGGNYGKTYKIKINGVEVANYVTPNGTDGSHAAQIGTDFIAQQLFNDLLLTINISSLGALPQRTYFDNTGSSIFGVRQSANQYYLTAIRVPASFQAKLLTATYQGATYQLTDDPFITQGFFNEGTMDLAFDAATVQASSTFTNTNGGFDPFNPGATFKTVWIVHPGLPSAPNFTVSNVLSTTSGGNVTVQSRDVKLFGSTIWIKQDADFSIEASDDFNNNAMQAYKGEIQDFAELPANGGPEGFTIKVTGDSVNEEDDFFLRWVPSPNSVNTGVWQECPEPNSILGLQEATMPHILVRNADNTFTFKRADWGKRKTGTSKSNPAPSFVGKKISNLFFFKNRLGFTANEQVVMSEASEFFNFYRTTVRQLLDSDVIDIAVGHTRVSDIQYAIPASNRLILMSSQTQFFVQGNELLTPKTANARVLTEFDCSTTCQPKLIGRNLYFPYEASGFTRVREFYVDADDVADAADIASHVERYIPTGVHTIAEAANEDFMALLTNTAPNEMYVYKFYLQGNEKLQSSWSVWEFGPQEFILGAGFIQSTMYVVKWRGNQVMLESINLRDNNVNAGEPYRVLLDNKVVKDDGFYQAPNTLFTMPYPVDASQDWFGVIAAGQEDAGLIIPLIPAGSNTLVAEGKFDGLNIIIGSRYTFRYTFSTLYAPKPSNGARQADQLVRLQLRNMSVNYNDTGYFKALVTPENRDTYTYVFSGKILGVPSATIGEVSLSSGSFRFPINTKNLNTRITLVNDTPLPATFTSADWEALYVKRTRGT